MTILFRRSSHRCNESPGADAHGDEAMRNIALAALSAIALSACAGKQPGMIVEQGYQRGALGVAAIDRGDWTAAETQLAEQRGLRSNDPARLINLGKVYAETGRVED